MKPSAYGYSKPRAKVTAPEWAVFFAARFGGAAMLRHVAFMRNVYEICENFLARQSAMPISSRYFATVRREIAIPITESISESFWSL